MDLRIKPHHRTGDAANAARPDPTPGIRGSAMIFVTVAMVSCIAFSVLTLDVGMILMAKIQLQNAADAAALAGASAFLDGGGQPQARARAIAVAGENVAWQDGLDPVVIADADVTFPSATRCRVRTHRTRATGDALRTFFIGVLNPGSDRLAEANAVAEAEVMDICGASCFKPWSPVDRWDDTDADNEYDYAEPYTDTNANGQYDLGEPFTDTNANAAWDPDEPYDPLVTGYQAPADVGLEMTLKLGSPSDTITPGHFYAIELDGDPDGGASEYRDCIQEACCQPNPITLGDSLLVKTGNMVGPTRQGTQDLIDQDPGAYWDNTSQSVLGSAYGTSPRVVKIALFDPRFTPKSGRNWVRVTNLGAFFVESVQAGNVTGRYVGLTTTGDPCAGPGEPTFLVGLRLVE